MNCNFQSQFSIGIFNRKFEPEFSTGNFNRKIQSENSIVKSNRNLKPIHTSNTFTKHPQSTRLWEFRKPGHRILSFGRFQGNYAKFLKNLHSEQIAKLVAKNQHECELLEDIRTFTIKKSSIEKSYSEVNLILCAWVSLIIFLLIVCAF